MADAQPLAELIKTQRKRLGHSQDGVAKRMRAAAKAEQTNCGATRQSIHEYEHGDRIPRTDSLRWLAAALELPLSDVVTAAELQEHERYSADCLEFAPTLAEALTLARGLWRHSAHHQDFLANTEFDAEALIRPSWLWLCGRHDGPAARIGGQRVTTTDIERIWTDLALFGQMDQRHGGGHLRWLVVEYLHREVTPLLEGSYTDRVGRDLFAVAAGFTRKVGMMAYDTDHHGLAQRYFVQALRLAHAAGDRALGANTVTSMSHQAIDLGHSNEALQLSIAAQQATHQAIPPTLLAKSAIMEARAHAQLGDLRACENAIARATTAFEHADPARDPHWMSSANQAYLTGQIGLCYLDLGQADRAASYLRSSLHDHRNDHLRRRAMATAQLACSAIQQGELEEACSLGRQAIALVGRLKSRRSTNYLKDLTRRLEPYRQEPPVKEFREQALTLVRAV